MGNEAHRGYGVQGYGAHGEHVQDHVLNEYCQYLLDLDGGHGRWGMGHGAHRQWGPWAIGTFLPITPLILDGFLQKFNWT